MKKRVSALATAFAFPLLAAAGIANAANITTIVTANTSAGENQPGWLFNRDTSTATPYEFNEDEAKIGYGSLFVKPIGSANAKDKFIGEDFINAPIADIDSVSFDFKLGAGVPAAKASQFYFNVYANFGESDDLKFYDCRYNIVASSGSDSSWTTVSFDPTQNYSVTTRLDNTTTPVNEASPYACPASPAGMDTLSPGSTIRVYAINVGDTSSSDAGVSGYLDNVVVTKGADVAVSDFEPVLTPSSKNDCKNDGWKKFNTPTFTNQGSCVSAVTSKGKNSILNTLMFWN